MNFKETLDFLYSILPMYQRVGKVAYKKDLSNTIELLEVLDNPQEKFKSVHIAGTNGKGTSAHGIAAIMQSAGYKTGLYTSPHLKHFTERIKINGVEMAEQFVVESISRLALKIEEIKPSFFEVTVAIAFQYFAEKKVDIAIIETGLGGRLDSTNVIAPEATLITNIGLDHTDLLGDTLEKIAKEKAGIIKSGVPIVLGKYQEEIFHIFSERADKLGASLVHATKSPDINLPVNFPYYKEANQSGVTNVISELRKLGWKISDEDLKTGFNHLEKITGFKGRFQVLEENPYIIADISHNLEGLKMLFSQIKKMLKGRFHLIFGTVVNKELDPIFNIIPRDANIMWTQSSVPRALPVAELVHIAEKKGLKGNSFSNVNSAIRFACEIAEAHDTILITGSTFVVAEIDNL